MGLSNEAKESILQAMDIIANKATSELAFDSTVKATIVDDENSGDGYYIVLYDNIKFTAYSENSTYKKDDCVRVSIPNSDFSEKKYILGKWAGDSGNEPITYTSVANTVLEIINLKNSSNILDVGIEANGDTTAIDLKDYTPALDQSFLEIENNDIFNTLFIEASFQSNLNNVQMVSGEYGLNLYLYDGDAQIINTLSLDSSEFFGNPYAFTIPVFQSKKLNISNLGQINSLGLEFYQNKDFSYYDGENSEPVVLETTGLNNIFLRSLRIGIGTDLSQVEDNTVKIFCNNDLSYEFSDRSKDKELSLIWYNKTKDNTYVGFNDGIAKKEKDEEVFDYTNYDENTYLSLTSGISRLKSQISEDAPSDRDSLELKAATILEGGPAVEEAYKILDKDLPSTLQSIIDRIGNCTSITNELRQESSNGVLSGIAASVETSKRILSNAVSREQWVYSIISYEKGDTLKKADYDLIAELEVKGNNSCNWQSISVEGFDRNQYFWSTDNETYTVRENIRVKTRKKIKVFPVVQQIKDLLKYGAECEQYCKADHEKVATPSLEFLKQIYLESDPQTPIITAETICNALSSVIDSINLHVRTIDI